MGININDLLTIAVQKKASDCHIKPGLPPRFRIHGELTNIVSNVITHEIALTFLDQVLTKDRKEQFQKNCDIDGLHVVPNVGRFRYNFFRQKGLFHMVFRHIPNLIPTVDGLGLPKILKEFAMAERGIILVTGTTGSGKSTSLAAMINHINENDSLNIITIEDPVEFFHTDKKCLISQRTLGEDVPSFSHALKYVLRQDPDVILVGEMRDQETISTAITAAETGHLVFSTLHTTDAQQTVERIIDTYPSTLHHQIRKQIALNLQGVVSQRLLPKKDGTGRVAALEILVATPTVRKIIAEGEVTKLYKVISEGELEGMQTFNQALLKFLQQDLITEEEAFRAATRPEELKLALQTT
ncbi:MAG: type IV pilus twitching motility protein PilT [Candidatus Wallbacteria bacterium]|nr:type IV pilus twitching motility protein PilT [Candidatus Wallbacteria bacterium]